MSYCHTEKHYLFSDSFFIGQVGLLVFADLSTRILRDASKILADKDQTTNTECSISLHAFTL